MRLQLSGNMSLKRLGFNPAVLFAASEQGAWFDPGDITTLFQDTAGSTPVTAAGQSVARINDKSGRGNHATQSNAANRPLYDVDASGRGFLLFDGTDDWLQTGTITPGTDKAQVFAGVRKLSDAARGMLAELGNNAAQSFRLEAPNAAGSIYYSFTSIGTTPGLAGDTNAARAAPTTNVLTGLGDIAADTAILRVNRTQVATSAADQGTGNFLAYPLFIGRRGGSSLPYNGRLYSLIARFGANLTADQIAATEAWVNGRTGAY